MGRPLQGKIGQGLVHLAYYGSILLGTPQSMLLIEAERDYHAAVEALRVIVREFDCGRTPLARDIDAARAALAAAGLAQSAE